MSFISDPPYRARAVDERTERISDVWQRWWARFMAEFRATLSANLVNETPQGDVDGINQDFELSDTPATGTLLLWDNGLLQQEDVAFTLTGTAIRFEIPPSSWLAATYQIGTSAFAYETLMAVGDAAELTDTPLVGTLRLYVAGVLQQEDVAYTLLSTTVTFSVPTGDAWVYATYET